MMPYVVLGAFIIGVVGGWYFENTRLNAQYDAEKLELSEKIAEQKEYLLAMSDQVVSVYTRQQTKTEVKYRTIIKEVSDVATKDPNSAKCVIGAEWVRIYNEALKPAN
jgi:hypothetical protein